MDRITLRMGNVVKQAASEEAARAFEAKGFVRDGAGGGTARNPDAAEVADLKKKLAKAAEAAALADKKKETAEKELKDALKKLQEAEKRNGALQQELAGTKEQLEAAVEKNKAATGTGK